MKKKLTYTEVKDADYIMKMMEDVFGHRMTTWSPADTRRLHGKLNVPVSDEEREEHVRVVEPLMNKKSIIPKMKDVYLDSFLDLDTRVSQQDFEPEDDPDADELNTMLGTDI